MNGATPLPPGDGFGVDSRGLSNRGYGAQSCAQSRRLVCGEGGGETEIDQIPKHGKDWSS
jgi:hypothetical protein